MTRPFVYLRYTLFFILAATFAVQVSVAAWNLQIEQSLTSHSQLDSYLIFCGAFGLLVIFPVACIDIARRNAVFAAVWFEVLWLGTFFVLNTAGAAALTALMPQLSCSQKTPKLRDPSCKSTTVLTGITWAITVIVLFYMTILIICAILHHDAHPEVWGTGVRDFAWFEDTNRAESLNTPPCSPTRWCSRQREPKQQHQQAPPIVHAPKPKRAPAPPVWTSYEVEHYTDDSFGGQQYSRAPAPPPPAVQQMQSRRGHGAVSLYPSHMEATVPPVAPIGLPSSVRPIAQWPSTSSSPRNSRQQQQQRPRPSHQTSSSSQREVVPSPVGGSSSKRPPRGPRNRPSPLDLSQVSSYR